MAIQSITKPMALDETLQSTNTALGGVAKDTTLQSTNGKMDSVITKLQGIIDALGIKTSVYKAGGDKTCAELVPALLIEDYCGYVYNITDTGTTTSDFVEGAGKPINIGDNVGIVDRGTGGNHVYKFDLMAGMVDLTDYIKKSSTSGFVKNDGTIDTTTYQPTEAGKGLSSNDYTSAEKTKLAGIATGATKTEASTTNGNVKINGTETQVYNDEEIQGKLTTDTATSTGNPINFTTKTVQNAVSTIIDLEPIQDLHGYDKPWVGGSGKNKFNKDDSYNSTNYRISTSAGNIYPATGYTASKHIEIKQNTSYVLQTSANFQSYMAWYDDNKNYLSGTGWTSGTAKTPPENAKYVRFDCQTSDIDTVMFEEGASPTSYEPYKNICPISGRSEIDLLGCGKNLLSGIENGAWNTSTQTKTTNTNRARSNQVIQVVPNTTYRINATTVSKTINCSINYYTGTGSGTYINSSGWQNINYSFTTPNNCRYITIIYATQSGSDANPEQYISNAQLELGSSATNYSPYTSSNNIAIAFGETVYGGSLDVENGVLRVDRSVKVFTGDNSEEWELYNQNEHQVSFQIHLYGIAKASGFLATNYLRKLTASEVNTEIGFLNYNDTWFRTYFPKSFGITDISGWKTYLTNNNLQLAYEIDTPVEIQLTPHQISLLKGINNISVSDDYSTITLTYRSGEVATLGDLLEVEKKIPSATAQHNYSTEEQVIGTWIDGSTVYERVFDLGADVIVDYSAFTNTTINASQMKILIDAWGIYSTGVTKYSLMANISNDIIRLQTDRNGAEANVRYVILQYTKST